MDEDFFAVPAGLAEFSAANVAASAAITASGSADAATMLNAASTLGPIGVSYLAAYFPAQTNCLAGTLLVGAATDASMSAIMAPDNG